MEAITLAVVSAGLSQPSSTRLLADRLGEAVRDRLVEAGREVRIEHVELRELAHPIADNLVTGFPGEALRQAIDTVTGADALVAVSPIFSASYSGLFKSFFDVLEQGALTGKPALLGATGGTARHSLALDHALRPLFAYLRAAVVPTAVYAASEDWASAERNGLRRHIDRAADELAAVLLRQPARTRRPDAFAEVVPFEQQLVALKLP
ncbi:FMN reductase [Streptacidiphilus neutrinimicus]|uniref:FMN reductase n=1 Tax=Streptacidiphilus neutrinimicus TaxID=105420 RepID=UPI0005A762F4|nr:FMN reductase [Streptacidiphilus neutrinimicus]